MSDEYEEYENGIVVPISIVREIASLVWALQNRLAITQEQSEVKAKSLTGALSEIDKWLKDIGIEREGVE